ncbi:MAG: radical SAM protein, partial [Pseudonocardiales bacterium]|nr:radical SAM protein [Pseudonocardiales bacterium]
MRVGILDILGPPSSGHPVDIAYKLLLTKQFASITPQAISVWCRRLGHETFYATYYGIGDPHRALPSDLDVVFIACYTQTSPIAYALGRLYRKAGVRTVLGGPHAKAFPPDCLRFFDLVVKECDADLISDILAGHFDPGAVITSSQSFADVPTVEERMPEIRAANFYWGRKPLLISNVPMLASLGCPYTCNFCIDWNNAYRPLSRDRLAADLRYVAEHLPGRLVAFHAPNFGVKFDQVFEVLEELPPPQRPPYVIESSLTLLRGERLERLRTTNCVFVAPGVESWTDYSNKAGMGRKSGLEKVNGVVDQFRRLGAKVPYLQANFMFGLDTDEGDDPVELTKLFMDQTPFAWPVVNIPMPFGG